MNMIFTAAMVLASYAGMAGTEGGNYAYNADIENGRVNAIDVYDNSQEFLSPKLQYRFLYDDLERVASKEVLKWDSQHAAWTPARRYEYAYGDGRCTVSLCQWDEESGTYGNVKEQTVYDQLSEHLVAVDTYRCDGAGGTLTQTDKMLVMTTRGDLIALAGRQAQ